MKSTFIDKSQSDARMLFAKTKQLYDNKYYNLFINKYIFDGGEIDEKTNRWIMKELWSKGTLAAFLPKNIDDLICFVPYTSKKFNMYDDPEEIVFVNKRNLDFIPNGVQVVDKDAAICFILPNKKGVSELVAYYIDRIVQVEMVVNTNLQLHKLPYLVAVSPADRKRCEDLIDKILNNEIVVFADLADLELLKSIANNSQYIIDKLYSYKTSLENELLTLLGIDNALQSSGPLQNLTIDQVNANNALINSNEMGMQKNIKAFLKKIKDLFNVEITLRTLVEPVKSIYEEKEKEIPGPGNRENEGENGNEELQ